MDEPLAGRRPVHRDVIGTIAVVIARHRDVAGTAERRTSERAVGGTMDKPLPTARSVHRKVDSAVAVVISGDREISRSSPSFRTRAHRIGMKPLPRGRPENSD